MADPRKWWTSSDGSIELQFTSRQIKSVPRSGPADTAIFNLSHLPSITAQTWTLTDATLQNTLREYGAWTDEELSCRIDNIQRLLWLAITDLQEEL